MRKLRPLAFAALAIASAVAPLQARLPAPQAGDAGGASPLERALDAVRTERIVADVFYVACDDMGGRDTPSTGQRLTARFIKNRLQRLGWKPGAKDGWFHTYPLNYKRVKEPDTHVLVQRGDEKLELEFGKDYFFSSREIEALEVSGSVVFCGGATKEEVAGFASLKGKWALAYDGGGGDAARAIEERLRGAGAIGVLFTQAPGGNGRNYIDDFTPRLAGMRAGRATWPDEGEAARPPLVPRLYLPKESAERVLAFAEVGQPAVGEELPIKLTDTRRLQGDGKVTCENVCGWWPGKDPALRKEAIIVSAHYDHVGIGADGQIFNGADDNGSGTCGLLALAEALVVQGPLRRSVMLIWVSGEEKGLYGSQAWTSAPWLPDEARAIADINIDMIGRNAPNQILVTPSKAHAAYNGLTKIAERFAGAEGFTDVGSADLYYTRSDHANFAKLGIPVTFLFSDVHADYHRPTDDPEKIDGDKSRRVVRLVLRMINEMQADALDLTH